MSDFHSRPVDQLGYVVSDLSAAIDSWLAQGIGPWLTLERTAMGSYRYRERGSAPEVSAALSYVQGVYLIVLQPIGSRPSSFRDFVASGRRGIQHVAWFAEDYDAECAKLDTARTPIIQSGSWSGIRFAYFDLVPPLESLPQRIAFGDVSSRKVDAIKRSVATFDGAIGEIIELNGTSSALFSAIKRASLNWDGRKDPVRPLLSPAIRALFRAQAAVGGFVRTVRGK